MHGGCTYADQPAPTPADLNPSMHDRVHVEETVARPAKATRVRAEDADDGAGDVEQLRRDLAAVTRERDLWKSDSEGRLIIAKRDDERFAKLEADLAATRERLIDAEAERDAAVRRAERAEAERVGTHQAYREQADRAEAAEARVRELEVENNQLGSQLIEADEEVQRLERELANA